MFVMIYIFYNFETQFTNSPIDIIYKLLENKIKIIWNTITNNDNFIMKLKSNEISFNYMILMKFYPYQLFFVGCTQMIQVVGSYVCIYHNKYLKILLLNTE